MTHYFRTPGLDRPRHEVRARIWDRDYSFVSAAGVFSANRLDIGTSVLFRQTAPPPRTATRLCDLGCGFGAVAIALATHCPTARVDAVDVNDLALALTGENAVRYQVADRVRTGRPEQFEADTDQGYDEIWSNPPIRIGKPALHELLLGWLPRLRPGGTAWLVVGKNLGADSLQGWLGEQGWPTLRVGSAKGFRVLRTQRNPPAAVGGTA